MFPERTHQSQPIRVKADQAAAIVHDRVDRPHSGCVRVDVVKILHDRRLERNRDRCTPDVHRPNAGYGARRIGDAKGAVGSVDAHCPESRLMHQRRQALANRVSQKDEMKLVLPLLNRWTMRAQKFLKSPHLPERQLAGCGSPAAR